MVISIHKHRIQLTSALHCFQVRTRAVCILKCHYRLLCCFWIYEYVVYVGRVRNENPFKHSSTNLMVQNSKATLRRGPRTAVLKPIKASLCVSTHFQNIIRSFSPKEYKHSRKILMSVFAFQNIHY